MKLGTFAVAIGFSLLTWMADTASAQLPYRQPSRTSSLGGGPPKLRKNSPTVSPYLNLLGGRGVGYEYYNRVRPQEEFRKTAAALGRSIQDLQANQAQLALEQQPEIGTTGHAATFMSHSRYFNVGPNGSPSSYSAGTPRR